MADNVTLPGTGALVATDEITRAAIVQHAQLFKLIFGGDGVYNGMLDVGQQAMAASIPVVLASNQSAIPVSQSGTWTVTANVGTIAGIATETTLSALNTKVTACNTGAVVISSALPAGANVIGKVSIDQTTPGTTNLVAAGQSGTWNITNVSGTVSLPTGAATAARQDTGNSSLAVISDAYYSVNTTWTKSQVLLGGVLDDVTPSSPSEGNVSALRMTALRALHVHLRDNSGTEFGTSGNPVRTDPTGSTTQPISGSVTATVTPASITPAAPAASSVGVTSAQILASATYKRVELVNTSANTISIGIGSTAVLNSGMTMIGPGSSATIEGPFTAAVNAIASVAASNLAIQAWT